MAVVLARVDNRLVHGQVLEAWMPRFDITTVVVVDDGVAGDRLRQTIMEIAVPSQINCRFVRVDEVKETLEKLDGHDSRVMMLFSGIRDVRDALRMGSPLDKINIGNVHYRKGKRRITSCVSLGEDEIHWLMEIGRRTQVEMQALPDDPTLRFPECMEKGNGGKSGVPEEGGWWERLKEKLHLK